MGLDVRTRTARHFLVCIFTYEDACKKYGCFAETTLFDSERVEEGTRVILVRRDLNLSETIR